MITAAPTTTVRPARGDWRVDLQRGLLALSKIIKFGLFPFAGAIPFLPWRLSSFAVRFRCCLEELGLTYLKLGQFLALRFDILPVDVCLELSNLFDKVRPMPTGVAQSIVERELGVPIERMFSAFSAEPIAAASVAQVHEARLPDGSRVAVKVQRAGIERIFKADIRNLRRLTAVLQRLGMFGRLLATGMVDQFERWTLQEMDFRIEGRTAERVRRNAGAAVVIPSIYWLLTTARVLTMDFIEGVSARDFRTVVETSTPEELQRRLPGVNVATALHNFTEGSLMQLFVDGFFHGDPHPGNIVFLSHNRVAFLDFGIFGALNVEEREIVSGQIESLALGDLRGSLCYYSRQVAATADTDFDRFRTDCLDVLKRWYWALSDPRSPIEERHLARYTGEMIDVSRRNGLIYDLNYLLFWRALNNLNATLWHIQPDYDLIAELRAFFSKTRPDPFERTLDMLESPTWRQSVVGLGFHLPSRLAAGITASRGTAPASVRPAVIWSSRREHRMASEGAVAMALLLSVSAAAVLAAPGPWGTLRWGLLGLLAGFGVLAVRWRQ